VAEIAPPIAASPLAGVQPLQGAVGLWERTRLGGLNLRGIGAPFLAAVDRVLGFRLPIEPNTTSRRDDVLALWLGPDEWLLHAPFECIGDLETTLREALQDQCAALTDVTDQLTVLHLTGQHARTVLAKGCPLDLHYRVFEPGRCAQSHFLKVGILIYQVDNVPSYDIRCRRSFAEYLWATLVDAAQEFR